jgi:hypothetical protein
LLKVWEEKQGREAVTPPPVDVEAENVEVGGGGSARSTRGKNNGKGKGKAKEPEWSEEDYRIACGKLAYEQIDMGVESGGESGGRKFPTQFVVFPLFLFFLSNFYNAPRSHYHRDIDSIANSRRPQHGFTHLAKELAVLSTSLPPGIWLRVDESRVDVLKCASIPPLIAYSSVLS